MATTNTCDLCGEVAVDEVEVKSKTTTPIKLDVCQTHLEEYKRIMRVFMRRELPYLIIDDLQNGSYPIED